MRFLIAAALLLSCSLCLAEDLPQDTNEIKSLTVEQAAELAKLARWRLILQLDGLTSIDKDVAQELTKFKGRWLYLDGLTSIDKDVAQELAKFQGWLYLNGLTSIDKEVFEKLKSNERIILPYKYRDKKD